LQQSPRELNDIRQNCNRLRNISHDRIDISLAALRR
jgi:hypothetical protein